jgi:hypothetical protein
MLSILGYGGSLTSTGSLGAATEQQKEADPSCIDAAAAAAESENAKGVAKSEAVDLGTRYMWLDFVVCRRLYLCSTHVGVLMFVFVCFLTMQKCGANPS